MYAQKYTSCIWGIAENYYYEPYFLEAKKYLDEGKIGELRIIVGNFFTTCGSDSPYFHTQWRRDPNYLGGYVLDGGVHVVSALRLLVGDIECISGFQKQFIEELPPADSLVCSFQGKNGIMGTLALSWACNQLVAPFKENAPPLFTIIGTTGVITVSRDKLRVVTEISGQKETIEPVLPRNQYLTAVVKEIDCFVEAIHKKSKSLVYTPHQALQDVAFIEAVFKNRDK